MRTASFLALAPVAAICVTAPAQTVFQGNGVPSAYVENSPARVGQSVTLHLGSPTTPGSVAALCISGSIGPTVVPLQSVGVGNVGLDLSDPGFQIFLFGLDQNGDVGITVPLPPGTLQAGSPPLFAAAVTFESTFWSVSKSIRADWANADGWEATGSLGAQRQLHTATAIGYGPRDNRTEVLICGGATGSIIIPQPTATAELYAPLTRSTIPLPNMALPRSGHATVLTPYGLVLVTGGVTTGGVVTSTCEFFDPASRQFLPAPSMSTPRAGHRLTVLDDGRILATGGFADWQNAATSFIAALNTAQDTAEVFDITTFSWQPLPSMSGKRAGHGQTRLLDGRVLVTGGIAGGFTGTNPLSSNGQVPFYNATCQIFDPATNLWSPTAPLNGLFGLGQLPARAYHGQSLLPNGHVLISGGFVPASQNGEAVANSTCVEWDGLTWQFAGVLPVTAAMHTQVPNGAGALIIGGFTGDLTALQTTAQVVQHNGLPSTAPVSLASIGIDQGSGSQQSRGAHSCTPLYDGSFLVYGGGLWPATRADGWIYTPN